MNSTDILFAITILVSAIAAGLAFASLRLARQLEDQLASIPAPPDVDTVVAEAMRSYDHADARITDLERVTGEIRMQALTNEPARLDAIQRELDSVGRRAYAAEQAINTTRSKVVNLEAEIGALAGNLHDLRQALVPPPAAQPIGPVRQAILDLVRQHGPIARRDLAEKGGMWGPTVSVHLSALSDMGLVKSERSGRAWMWSAT